MSPERAAESARAAANPQGPTRKLKADENDIFNGKWNQFHDAWCLLFQQDEGQLGAQEVRNERALFVYNRVQNKITGKITKNKDNKHYLNFWMQDVISILTSFWLLVHKWKSL